MKSPRPNIPSMGGSFSSTAMYPKNFRCAKDMVALNIELYKLHVFRARYLEVVLHKPEQ